MRASPIGRAARRAGGPLVLGLALAVAPGPAAAQEGLAALRKALNGADLERAEVAAQRLAKMRTSKATGLLVARLQLGGPPGLVLSLIAALGSRKSAEATPILTHYAGHRGLEVRLASLEALGAIGGKAVSAVLVDALGDSKAPVRAVAARLLGQRRERSAEPVVIAMLRRGDGSAALPLGQLGGPESVSALAEVIGGGVADDLIATALGTMLGRPTFGPDPVRLRVVKALGRIQSEVSTAALVEYVASVPPGEQRPSRLLAEQLMEQRQQ